MTGQDAYSRRDFLSGLRRDRKPVKAVAQVGEQCLSLRGISCRTCDDACDVRAIQFSPQLQGRFQLSINQETCTACGNCVEVCPVSALSIIGDDHHA